MIRIENQTDQMKSTKKVTDSVRPEDSPNDQDKKPDQMKSTKKVTDSVRSLKALMIRIKNLIK